MNNLGFFSMPWTGHLNPMLALAGELKDRGHRIHFFHLPEVAPAVLEQGFDFVAYESVGLSLEEHQRRLSQLQGEEALACALELSRALAQATFHQAGPVVGRANLDLWVIDQLDYASACLAAALGQPFVTVAVTLLKQEEEGVPGFTGGPPGTAELQRMSTLVQPFRQDLSAFRQRHGLGPFEYDSLWSNLAQISQQPAEFEFPRRQLPGCFHFTGPFLRPQQRAPVAFPWTQLNGLPLVYASFGTAHQPGPELLAALLTAVGTLPVQLVLSLPKGTQLPAAPPPGALVLPYVPQWEVLQQASLMVHHAGMNSTLECLAAGVPMVAIPLSHDQPGVAARIEWTGTGQCLPPDQCTAQRLEGAMAQVLNQPDYKAAAGRFRESIERDGGLARAADIVEQVLHTGRPVLRG